MRKEKLDEERLCTEGREGKKEENKKKDTPTFPVGSRSVEKKGKKGGEEDLSSSTS